MPQGENFWNPYRMIPVKAHIEKKPPLTDEKFKGKSGMISCSLENLTPLFIGGNRNFRQNFMTRNGRCVIPGASLKGMLRSLAEIVGGGCMITDTRGQLLKYKEDDKGVEEYKKYLPCSRHNDLCITCRMFGMMERRRGARVHKGSVGIGDALLREDKPVTRSFQVLLTNCGTRHEPFYRSSRSGKLDGKSRKLYFHQPKRTDSVPNILENLKSRAWNINALLPGHHFDFEVQFSNLRDEELELLVYVLALEENVSVKIDEQQIALNGPMRHKIGNAKPLGMGTCKIAIEKMMMLQDPATRFTSLQNARDIMYEGETLRIEISRLTRRFEQDFSDTMEQVRKMMVWDENDPRDFKYPDYHWFKNSANSRKVLKPL